MTVSIAKHYHIFSKIYNFLNFKNIMGWFAVSLATMCFINFLIYSKENINFLHFNMNLKFLKTLLCFTQKELIRDWFYLDNCFLIYIFYNIDSLINVSFIFFIFYFLFVVHLLEKFYICLFILQFDIIYSK